MDPEDKAGAIGCAAGLVAIIGVVLAVVYMTGQDLSPTAEAEKTEDRAGTPLTKADPIRNKVVVDKAVEAGPKSLRITAGDDKDDDVQVTTGYVAAVQNLDQRLKGTPAGDLAEVVEVERVLGAEPLCYRGRIARQAPSLFSPTHGFAITYGALTLHDGTPMPRLELFVNQTGAGTFASYMSMTEDKVKGFPRNREVAIPYTSAAIDGVIKKWIAAVATETCPDKARALGLTGR